jgi:hypothetical protein
MRAKELATIQHLVAFYLVHMKVIFLNLHLATYHINDISTEALIIMQGRLSLVLAIIHDTLVPVD